LELALPVPALCKLVSRPYIIFDRFRKPENSVDILRYWHGAQREPDLRPLDSRQPDADTMAESTVKRRRHDIFAEKQIVEPASSERHRVAVRNIPLLTELDLFWNGILQRGRP
jgi:hypothetical protein